MTVAAVYARKSTEQNVSDDAKSVARQVELARAFAIERGWQVIDEYVDDAVSGRETAKLVDRARMLADATSGKFGVVVVRDYDRLSRDDREGPSFVYALQDIGVEIWEYAHRSPIDVSTALKRTMLNMKAGFSAHEAEAASERTREEKYRRAARGTVADGRVLGYQNVGEQGSRRRVVFEPEAELVRRIFTMAAEGKGILKIATTLNEEGVKNPTGQDRRTATKKTDEWSSTGIRAVLHRRLYMGEVTYGRTRNARRGGRRIKLEGEKPVTTRDESLRVVPEPLWQAVQDRMARTRAADLRRNDGRAKPVSGLESTHLLSGVLRCGVCGGNLIVSGKTGKRGQPQTAYICSTRRTRGKQACGNQWGAPYAELTDAVLLTIKERLFRPDVIEELVSMAKADHSQEPGAHQARREAIASRVTALDREIARYTTALGLADVDLPSVVDALQARQRERTELSAQLEHLAGLAKAMASFDVEAFREFFTDFVANLEANLRDPAAQPQKARAIIGPLLASPIKVTPWIEDGLLYFHLAWTSSYNLDAVTATTRQVGRDVTGRISRRVQKVCPRGDSNTRHAV